MDSARYDDVFCVDCDGYRRQMLKGRNIYDGTLLYLCTECECENSIEDELTKDLKQNDMK